MASSKADNVATVRQQLRSVHENLLANKSEYTATGSAKLGEVIDTVNKNYEISREEARAAALDASIIRTATALGAEQAGNLEKITPEKFIIKLKAQYGYMKGQAIKWTSLAHDVHEAGIFSPVPAPSFLQGKFQPPVKKQRAERKRQQRDGPSEPQETASQVDVDALQETSKDKAQVVRMKTLHGLIRKVAKESAAAGGPLRVNIFQVILHPTSFSQTVENFFDLSFLVKDGSVALSKEGDAMYVAPSKPPKTDDFMSGLFKTQNILQIDYPTYRRLVSARSCSVGKEAADAESERVEREHACAHFVAGAALAECSPIERVDARTLSVDGFRARYMMPSGDGTPPKPVILTHALDEWPALSAEGEASWRPQQLKARLGTRLVPVETYSTEHATSTYLSDSWEQRVMAFGEYIDRYCLCGDSGGGSSGSDDDREEDVTMARGYLAQHQLFDQIPPLREGIRTPSYCAALTPDDESAPPSCEFRTDPLVSAWFGPGGTVSPLHNDPFHNLLAQAVGYKYVRLIDAAHTPRLYPRSTLPNNSHVNLDQPDPAAHPKFAGTPFHHAVLGPTEALYIPRHCWHYVRSLETSFSVSFWWGAKIALLLRPDGELAKVY